MYDRRRPLQFTIVLLLFVCPAFAQRDRDNYVTGLTFEVSGEVRLPEGRPLTREITVHLERFSGGIVDQMAIDDRGKFRFSNLQRGYYTVYVSAPGYKQARQQADLQVVTRTYLVFELTPVESNAAPNPAVPVIDARVPIEAQAEFARGRAALLDKKVKDALHHLERAISLYPEFFEAQFLLATAHMDALQLEDAKTALRRASEIKPESAAVLILLGEVHRRQKQYAEAEKVLLEAIRLDDKSWQGHFTLGHLYWDMGDVAKAGSQLGRTLQLKSDFAEAHLLAGNILLRVNQPERALIEYEEYLRLTPKGEFAGQARELVRKLKSTLAERKRQ